MVYDIFTETYQVAAVPISGLRRRHSGDKRADKLHGHWQHEAHLYRQNRSKTQPQHGNSFCGKISAEDSPQGTNSGPADTAATTAASSSTSEHSASSGWACAGVLKRLSSLGSALPRVQVALLKSGSAAAAAAARGSNPGNLQEDIASSTAFMTPTVDGSTQKSTAFTASSSTTCATDGAVADDVTSTAATPLDWLRDVASRAGPDQNQSRKSASTDAVNYMAVSVPSGSAGVPSTKLLITTAAGVVGRGMNIKAAKDPRKSE